MKKLISWNVNGLRACLGKNFMEFFDYVDADIFCLQETKIQEGQVDWNKEGYYAYWNYAEKKGYSGTAIFSKEKPLNVTYGIGIEEHDKEGRVITLEFDNYYMVTVYTPNSQNGLARLEYRMKWEDDFRNYLLNLKKNKPVIVTGDMNVAHKEIDLKNPKTNRKNAGFTDEENEGGSVCACVRNGAEKEIRPAQEQESKKMDENCHCRGGDRRCGGRLHGQGIQKGKRLSRRQLSGGSGHPAGSDAVRYWNGDPEARRFL